MELAILPLVAQIYACVRSIDIFSCLALLDFLCAQVYAIHHLRWENIVYLFDVKDDPKVNDAAMTSTATSTFRGRQCLRNVPVILYNYIFRNRLSDVASKPTLFDLLSGQTRRTPVKVGEVAFFYLSKGGLYGAGMDSVPGPMKAMVLIKHAHSGGKPSSIMKEPWPDGADSISGSTGKMKPMADVNPYRGLSRPHIRVFSWQRSSVSLE